MLGSRPCKYVREWKKNSAYSKRTNRRKAAIRERALFLERFLEELTLLLFGCISIVTNIKAADCSLREGKDSYLNSSYHIDFDYSRPGQLKAWLQHKQQKSCYASESAVAALKSTVQRMRRTDAPAKLVAMLDKLNG